MSILLAILLQSTAAPAATPSNAPVCHSGHDATTEFTKTVQEPPAPLGLVIGTGSDWDSKFLVVKTSHYLGVPGIPTRPGSTTITYYQTAHDRVCEKELTSKNCPLLEQALATMQSHSYALFHNRSDLRGGYAYHPPYAFVHAQDGDGNVTKISAAWPGHPLMSDASEFFQSISSCTTEIEGTLHGR